MIDKNLTCMYNHFMQTFSSSYKNSTNVRPLKKLGAYAIDYFFALVVTVFLYGLISLIVGYFPITTSTQKVALDAQNELYKIAEESHLSYRVDKTLVSEKAQIDRTIKANIIYTFKLNESLNKDKLNSNLYKAFSPLDLTSKYDNDGMFLYFNDFKIKNIEQYKNQEISDNFYYETILKSNEKNYFVKGLYNENLEYYLINQEASSLIHEYFLNNEYAKGKEVYDYIYNLFKDGFKEGRTDLINNFNPYIEANLKHQQAINEMLNIKGNSLLISYLVSVVICYLVLPLCFKNGKTLSFRVLKFAVVTNKENSPNLLNVSLNALLSLFSNFSSLIIVSFLVFGGQSKYFFDVNLLGFVNIYIMGFISLAFILLSYIFTFLNKAHSNIEEFLLLREIKDINEFKLTEQVVSDGN